MDFVNMSSIKRKLERNRCPKCNKQPTVSVVRNSFKIDCCCDNFKRTLSKIAENEVTTQSKKHIEDQLRRMFK